MKGAAGRIDRARTIAATIDGWLTDAEGEFLFAAAAGCPRGASIVEIGSWKGKSTVWLASGVREAAGTSVFAIDPHERSLEDPDARTLDELMANLVRADVAATVVPIVAASHDAAGSFNERPGVVFLDGSHLEAAVRLDLADWLPKLAEGGILALHDVLGDLWAGPRRALRDLLWHSTEIGAVRFVDTLAWMRKVTRNSAGDRIRNRFAVLLLMAYDLKRYHLPAPVAALLHGVYRLTPLKRRGRPPT